MGLVIVIVESPYRGKGKGLERNIKYLRAALRDCLLRGEAPFASHAIYTLPGVLDDNDPEEHLKGITAGFAFRVAASKTVVYNDLGITPGMQMGIDHARSQKHELEFRSLRDEELIKISAEGGIAWDK